MPAGDSEGIFLRQFNERGIVSHIPDERGTRGLAEPYAELHPGMCGDDRLVEVLHRLDKMRLPEDEIQVFRLLYGNRLKLHYSRLFPVPGLGPHVKISVFWRLKSSKKGVNCGIPWSLLPVWTKKVLAFKSNFTYLSDANNNTTVFAPEGGGHSFRGW